MSTTKYNYNQNMTIPNNPDESKCHVCGSNRKQHTEYSLVILSLNPDIDLQGDY